jgi:hypothetical protein
MRLPRRRRGDEDRYGGASMAEGAYTLPEFIADLRTIAKTTRIPARSQFACDR